MKVCHPKALRNRPYAVAAVLSSCLLNALHFQSLDYSARQLEALGVQQDSTNTGFGRSTHMARKKLNQAERTREALLKESLPTPSALPARRASIVGAGRRKSQQR